MGDEIGRKTQWYYNVITDRVEQEGEGKGTDQLGPYPSREAAQNALDSVREREERLRAEDAAWSGDDVTDE